MGRNPVAAIFGPLPSRVFEKPLRPWHPLRPSPLVKGEKPAPFKIGGMELPMVTYEGKYDMGVGRLAELLIQRFHNRPQDDHDSGIPPDPEGRPVAATPA